MRKFYLLIILFAVLASCKDTDGDNIYDKDDKCPDTFGLVEFNGCPDTDEDGIPDDEDECPDDYGLEEFNGCPDSDKDGIPDNKDDCPDEYGLEEFKGCPDNDKVLLLVSECLKSYSLTDSEINKILSDHDLTLNKTINYKMCSLLFEMINSSREHEQEMRRFDERKKVLDANKLVAEGNLKEINDGYIQAVYNQGNGGQYVVILKAGINRYYLMQVISGGECPLGGTAKFDETTSNIQQIWVRDKPHKIPATLFTMRLLKSSSQPFNMEKLF